MDIVTGVQDGTGASIDIELGWIPDVVIVTNIEAADFAELKWLSGMTDGHAIKRVTSVFSKITTLGITKLNSTFLGFRIGADADVNVAGESLQWVAYRMGLGSGG